MNNKKNILILFFIFKINLIFSMESDGTGSGYLDRSVSPSCQLIDMLSGYNDLEKLEQYCKDIITNELQTYSQFNVPDFSLKLEKNKKILHVHEAAYFGAINWLTLKCLNKSSNEIENILRVCDSGFNNPAHFAARKLNIEILKFIIGKNSFIFLANLDGETVIHIALKYQEKFTSEIICRCIDFIKLALKNFDDYDIKNFLNSPDKSGDTPLYLAVSKWDIKVVEFLIDIGADINILSEKSQISILKSSIERVDQQQNQEIFKLILSKLSVNNFKNLNSAILEYLSENKLNIFKELWVNRFKELHSLHLFDLKGWENCTIV